MTTAGDDGDYYRLLGLPRDASMAEVRRSYRRLARQHHPDQNPHPDSADRFRAIADAYAALNDPLRRARHDEAVGPVRPPRPSPKQPAVQLRCATLELSAHEAGLAAVAPLKLAARDGGVLVLPAGIREGDHIITRVANTTIVLVVRVSEKT